MAMPGRENESFLSAQLSERRAVHHTKTPCAPEKVKKAPAEQQRCFRTQRELLSLLGHQPSPANLLAIAATRSAAPGVPSLARTSASPVST